MKPDIVYVLGKGSVFDNNEMRLSLRSIEKHLKDYGRVFIVGLCPDWLENVTHIKWDDTEKIPDKNIMLKLKKACETPEISDDFLFFNDDHYLLSPYSAPEFPYYYCKDLFTEVKKRRGDSYGQRTANTMEYLKKNDLPTKYFDVHTPIIYNKAKFLEHVVSAVDWKKTYHGFVIKSLYANSLRIEGQELDQDVKFQQPPHNQVPLMSTYPFVKASMQRYLFELFPEKCTFEK